ncbi:hypothetical protein [Filimonas effusa]|uniref:Uncharacterized protein n=1 Tax=Filimonas effusa TaxID=2508721 RepID=A0A4V1M9E0_9BACT|nr:hypothetical protein [Filimonas effusa]RXK80772.1 hypothetical protein ESB13_21660 [Filimonas effusa]
MDRLQHYINSGVIEQYVLGLLNDNQKQEFEELLLRSPGFREEVLMAQLLLPPGATEWEIPPPISFEELNYKNETNELIRRRNARHRRETDAEQFIPVNERSSKYIEEDKGIIWLAIICVVVMLLGAGAVIWFLRQ